MSVNQIGIRNSNVFVPYSSTVRQSKILDVKSYITSDLTSWSCTFAYAEFRADSTGKWRMSINLKGTGSQSIAANAQIRVSMAGVTFVEHQTGGGSLYSSSINIATNTFVFPSSANIYLANASANTYTVISLSLALDIDLSAEPTWASLGTTAAAALEGVLPVSVYIPPAAAGIAGLVNNTAGNTVGTPILGRTDGQAVAAGYVGETPGTLVSCTNGKTYITSNTTQLSGTPTVIVSRSLSSGIYWVNLCMEGVSLSNGDVNFNIRIGGTSVYGTRSVSFSASNKTQIQVSLPINMSGTDTVDIHAVATANWVSQLNTITAIRIA